MNKEPDKCPLCGSDLWYDHRGAIVFCTKHKCDYARDMPTTTRKKREPDMTYAQEADNIPIFPEELKETKQ